MERPNTSSPNLHSVYDALDDSEIEQFIFELTGHRNQAIFLNEIADKLETILRQLEPDSQAHIDFANRWPESKGGLTRTNTGLDARADQRPDQDRDLNDFFHDTFGSCPNPIPRDEFRDVVRSWDIPSRSQRSVGGRDADYALLKPSLYSRIRAYWALRAPKVIFGACVGSLILICGLWQFEKYLRNAAVRAAFGWAVPTAKLFAGALWPTLFFMSVQVVFRCQCLNAYTL